MNTEDKWQAYEKALSQFNWDFAQLSNAKAYRRQFTLQQFINKIGNELAEVDTAKQRELYRRYKNTHESKKKRRLSRIFKGKS